MTKLKQFFASPEKLGKGRHRSVDPNERLEFIIFLQIGGYPTNTIINASGTCLKFNQELSTNVWCSGKSDEKAANEFSCKMQKQLVSYVLNY